MKFIKNGNLLSNNLVRQHVCRILGWLQEEDRVLEGAPSSSYPLLPLAALNFDRCLGLQSPVFRQELLLLPLSDVDARTDDDRRTNGQYTYAEERGLQNTIFLPLQSGDDDGANANDDNDSK